MGAEALQVLGWVVVIAMFAVGLVGIVYPILPSVTIIYAAFFVYGGFFGFGGLGVWFWIIETFILAVVFIADHVIGAVGVKKFGGSRASVAGSLIGLIAGPFVIPVAGLIVGPFIGAVAGELFAGKTFRDAVMAGYGSVVGLFSSMAAKAVLQIVMLAVFFLFVL